MDLEALQKAVKLSQTLTLGQQQPKSPTYSPTSPRYDAPESPKGPPPPLNPTHLLPDVNLFAVPSWVHPTRQTNMYPRYSPPRRRSRSRSPRRRSRSRSPRRRSRSPRRRSRSPPKKVQGKPFGNGGKSLGQTVDKMKDDHALLVKKVIDLENTIAVLQDSIHHMQAKMNMETSSRKRSRND